MAKQSPRARAGGEGGFSQYVFHRDRIQGGDGGDANEHAIALEVDPMLSAREQLDVITAYEMLGSYRGAAALCGVCDKTVRRVVERRAAGEPLGVRRRQAPSNTDVVAGLVERRVAETDGRITAKRLLPAARAAGYTGSDRNLRRAVAAAKSAWGRRRRVYRPWVPVPGEHLVIDWTPEAGMQVFCAVSAWSRWRFVRFAADQRRETTLALLAECFEEMGGVPAVVLADRMACLRAGVVANAVVPHPDYVRFAAHFGFRPDFCEAADPESKGVVEHLAGYVQTDLIVPAAPFRDAAAANAAAREWCAEVNGRVHSETAAVPAERLAAERAAMRALPSLRPPVARGVTRKVDRLATVRIGSARYSVPYRLVGRQVEVLATDGEVIVSDGGVEVARHRLVAPGEVSVLDDHYGGPRSSPRRGLRPRTGVERAFLALGPAAEAFLRQAAAAGTTRLPTELEGVVALAAAWGGAAVSAALERAVAFRRYKASDVAAILAAGAGVPRPTAPGEALVIPLPHVPTRSLEHYRMEAL